MNYRPRQRPLLGNRFAALLALILVSVGWSAQGAARASSAEPSRLDDEPSVASHADGASAQHEWCSVVHDAPQGEVSALDVEPDGDPVTPELPRLIRPDFGCAARFTSDGQVLRAATETYSVRSTEAPVLARAPPRGER